jgi:hypothetical protein
LRHQSVPPALHPTRIPWFNLVERCSPYSTTADSAAQPTEASGNSKPTFRKWINRWTANPKPFVWAKTADEIVEALTAYCKRISGSRL